MDQCPRRGGGEVNIDTIPTQYIHTGEGMGEFEKSETKKRFIPQVLGSALPFLSNFGAGLIKMFLVNW